MFFDGFKFSNVDNESTSTSTSTVIEDDLFHIEDTERQIARGELTEYVYQFGDLQHPDDVLFKQMRRVLIKPDAKDLSFEYTSYLAVDYYPTAFLDVESQFPRNEILVEEKETS